MTVVDIKYNILGFRVDGFVGLAALWPARRTEYGMGAARRQPITDPAPESSMAGMVGILLPQPLQRSHASERLILSSTKHQSGCNAIRSRSVLQHLRQTVNSPLVTA